MSVASSVGTASTENNMLLTVVQFAFKKLCALWQLPFVAVDVAATTVMAIICTLINYEFHLLMTAQSVQSALPLAAWPAAIISAHGFNRVCCSWPARAAFRHHSAAWKID